MSGQMTVREEVAGPPEVLRFGAFELNPGGEELRRSGALVKLQAQPTRLLLLLASRRGQVVSREEIRGHLWGKDLFVDHQQGINVCVRQIREVLGDSAVAPRFVETVPRRGYRFVAPVERLPGQAETVDWGKDAPKRRAMRWSRGRAMGRFLLGRSAVLPALGFGLVGVLVIAGWIASGSARAGAGRLRALPAFDEETAAESPSPIPRLVVLPLRSLDPGQETAPVAFGLTDQILTQLVRDLGSELGVIAQTSAFAYRDTEKSVAEIAAELQVQWVLEGSVRSDGDRVRITLQLSDADQLFHWANEYDQSPRTVRLENLELQSTLAEIVVRAVAFHAGLGNGASGNSRSAAKPPPAEAYRAFLDGLYWMRREGGGSPDRALVEFQRAVEIDSGFASGWLGVASARLAGGGDTGTGKQAAGEIWEEARKAVLRALELDGGLPAAHLLLSRIRFYWDWNIEGAGQSLRRALELAPHFAEAHRDMAAYFSVTGRHRQALAEADRAYSLDPFSPRVSSDLGWYAYFAGHPQEALGRCLESADAHPRYFWAKDCALLAALAVGDVEKARQLERSLLETTMGTEGLRERMSAETDPALAHEAFLRWEVARLEEAAQEDIATSAWKLAVRRMMLGDREAAIAWLERAVEAHVGWILPFLPVHPLFDPLRTEPRFEHLVRRVSGERGLALSRQATTGSSAPSESQDPAAIR
ncbi:MAG: winged helix-turn-helix domain-containing protein [Acidobacteria bacterium]|nr:winged helix-turn-helix domain-containing protein [Acidobacteriota bacterium]